MQIEALLTATRTRAHLELSSKKRALETLAELIANSTSGIAPEVLFSHLITRERLGSTGIGEGIAIPHCRFNTGGATLAALVTLAEPVDFDAIDGRPVDIIFALLVPENANEAHLQNLAVLAEALQNPAYQQALRAARSDQDLYQAAIGPATQG